MCSSDLLPGVAQGHLDHRLGTALPDELAHLAEPLDVLCLAKEPKDEALQDGALAGAVVARHEIDPLMRLPVQDTVAHKVLQSDTLYDPRLQAWGRVGWLLGSVVSHNVKFWCQSYVLIPPFVLRQCAIKFFLKKKFLVVFFFNTCLNM